MAGFIENNVEPLSKSAGDHQKVYRYLSNCGIEEVEGTASSLDDLRGDRNDADYKLRLDRFRDANTVNLLLAKARCAFNRFEAAIGSHKGRNCVVIGIKQYKATINL